MLEEVATRYGKPIFISETGAEGSARPAWLHYVCGEVREATGRGVRIKGICIYPVTAYPGWDNSRHADVGLFTTRKWMGGAALTVQWSMSFSGSAAYSKRLNLPRRVRRLQARESFCRKKTEKASAVEGLLCRQALQTERVSGTPARSPEH